MKQSFGPATIEAISEPWSDESPALMYVAIHGGKFRALASHIVQALHDSPMSRFGVCGLALMLSLCTISCSGKEGSGAAAPRLEVDADHWPLHVLALAQTTIHLVEQRGEPGYLTEIDVQLPDVNPPAVAAVTYQFYLPRVRKTLAVTYANSDVSISDEQMADMRRAGVAEMMQASIDATFAPQFNELPPPRYDFVPTPLFGTQIGMRDAWELARRAGLQRAHSITLKVGTKDSALPLLIWTFRGEHTLVDSKAVHINALTGALIDEDLINDITRAERDAQFAADQALIRAYFSRGRWSGGGWSAPGLTPDAAAVIDGGGQQEHGIYFDGLHDYTVETAADCAARGGNDGGQTSMGGNWCY